MDPVAELLWGLFDEATEGMDGRHRVIVARERGYTTLEAFLI